MTSSFLIQRSTACIFEVISISHVSVINCLLLPLGHWGEIYVLTPRTLQLCYQETTFNHLIIVETSPKTQKNRLILLRTSWETSNSRDPILVESNTKQELLSVYGGCQPKPCIGLSLEFYVSVSRIRNFVDLVYYKNKFIFSLHTQSQCLNWEGWWMMNRQRDKRTYRELNNISYPEGYWHIIVIDWKAQTWMKMILFHWSYLLKNMKKVRLGKREKELRTWIFLERDLKVEFQLSPYFHRKWMRKRKHSI